MAEWSVIPKILAGGLFAVFASLLILVGESYGIITVRAGHVYMALAWAVGSLIVWFEVIPRKPVKHKAISIVCLGVVMLVADLYLARKATERESNTKPLTIETITQAIKEAGEPTRADIVTTLVIDSNSDGNVRYHLHVENKDLPITITDIVYQTPTFSRTENGTYVPKHIVPGQSFDIPGEPLSRSLSLAQDTSFDLQIAYTAEIKGVNKDFVSTYQFLVTHPIKAGIISPTRVSPDQAKIDSNQLTAAEFELSTSTIFFDLPELRRRDNELNIMGVDGVERHFLFNPLTREVIFETKAQSGRTLRVEQPLLQSKQSQGMHQITLAWSPTHALLCVDGVEKEVFDARGKK